MIRYFLSIVLLFPMFAHAVTVMIDPGHSRRLQGALGIHQYEYNYNDALARTIYLYLTERGIEVLFTRFPGSDVEELDERPEPLAELVSRRKWARPYVRDLYTRAHLANEAKADYFISIHHDSVERFYLVPDYRNLPSTQRDTNAQFKNDFRAGHSLFVASENERNYSDSVRFATEIGRNLARAGYQPSNIYNILDKYDPVRPELGVYDSRLAVLRATNMPAVLLEAGHIVDADYEKLINTEAYRMAVAKAVYEALKPERHQPQQPVLTVTSRD